MKNGSYSVMCTCKELSATMTDHNVKDGACTVVGRHFSWPEGREPNVI